MNTSTRLKALLRNRSDKANTKAEILLRTYLFERFLERVSVSNYKQHFILKGGMLISAMVGINARTTMDMDATLLGKTLTSQEIQTIMSTIIRAPINDNIAFVIHGIEEIREEADYPGYRVSVAASYGKTRQALKIDITTGDPVTPSAIEYKYKLMFEDRYINIMAYNTETVLAEKFETIITRGIANTRMRDFYDIYILTTTQIFDINSFKAALYKTVDRRGTVKSLADMFETIQEITQSSIMLNLWQRYRLKYNYATTMTWEMITDSVNQLAQKVAPLNGNNPDDGDNKK
ncbi:MAG: nucleotidyl transferase AbiEii/AbiGii toxin family protein [Burkholderiales bacterium]|jgi:hypothetical protein|nr:nucleotidyl transferase AbiEii/AbiGii toxin family protein [Burkholderiales bacterium]